MVEVCLEEIALNDFDMFFYLLYELSEFDSMVFDLVLFKVLVECYNNV